MKKQLSAWLVLLIITLVAGAALGATYTLTRDAIDEQADRAAQTARAQNLPAADDFEKLTLAADSPLDWCYLGTRGGETAGYVAQITVNGFGGEIEITAGVAMSGEITGVSVGGAGFSETAGLGAKAKDSAFTDQYGGKTAPLTVIKSGGTRTESTIDAITSATITSAAVTNGVNALCESVKALMADQATAKQ